MMRQNRLGFWRRTGVLLALGVVLVGAEAGQAAKRSYRHHRRHHHHHSRIFLGFQYFGYPYGFYADGPYAYNPYAPGEHRRFPDFRLPGLFSYPGALGKGETFGPVSERPDDEMPATQGETQPRDIKSRR